MNPTYQLITAPYIIMTMAQGVEQFFLQCETISSVKSSPLLQNIEMLTTEVKFHNFFQIIRTINQVSVKSPIPVSRVL